MQQKDSTKQTFEDSVEPSLVSKLGRLDHHDRVGCELGELLEKGMGLDNRDKAVSVVVANPTHLQNQCSVYFRPIQVQRATVLKQWQKQPYT